jgi:DNA-binding beta-propeller fold protein YncE
MSPNGKVLAIADTTTHTLTKTIPFPDNVRVFVLNKDSSIIYTNLNNLLGFVIADVKTGKIIHKVEVQGYGWPENWNVTPRPRIPHACPSHGIALVNNEKELWLSDGLNNVIHIFDNTVFQKTGAPPKQISSIKTNGGAYWMTPSVDNKLIYASSGDVIDIASHKIIAQLKDEYGRVMHSEKLLDLVYNEGKLMQVSNQFANGWGSTVEPPMTTASAAPTAR